MRVWLVQAWPRWETALELAQAHLDAGDEVEVLGCDGEMTGCWLDYQHLASVCSKCVAVRRRALALLSPAVRFRSFLNLRPSDVEELRTMRGEFADLDELVNFQIEDFDIGAAVASGLMSTVRNSSPDVRRLGDEIRRSLASSWAMYRSLQNSLSENAPDCVYVANARGADARAVLRACQSRNVLCRVHESGHDQDHYEIFANALPHDMKLMETAIVASWEAAQPGERERLAAEWYQLRAGAADVSTFVGAQKAGLLPRGFDPGRRNIAIFNSSEDEFAALGKEWENPLYKRQVDGLRLLRASLAEMAHPPAIYVRMHPNLRSVDTEEVRVVRAMRQPGFEVIPPESPVSTYDLMRRCDTILTYGSTTGIEAVFWDKPSILAGVSWYRNLGGTYNPATHGELLDLLRQPLQPMDRTAALKYGYYMATFGTPFRYYHAERPMRTHFEVSGTFKGARLQPGALRHYFWAAVHRIPPLQKLLDAHNLRRSERKLGLR